MKRTIAAIAFLLSLSACSVKVDDAAPVPVDPPAQQRIPGPTVEGSWITGCLIKADGSSRIVDVKYTGETVVRTERQFLDNACTTAKKTVTNQGVFYFSENFGDGYYTINYEYSITGGTAYTYEKLFMSGTVLYLSDYINGSITIANMMKFNPKTRANSQDLQGL